MKKLLIAAAVFAAFVGNVHAAEMPEDLAGQWCQTRKWTDQDGYDVGRFIKAKNFCKETRPVVFTIHQVGFWIKLANTKTQILCVPLKVEDLRYGWSVVADCGADDLSTGVYRLGFSFESDKMGGITIMRWTPQEDIDWGPNPLAPRAYQCGLPGSERC